MTAFLWHVESGKNKDLAGGVSNISESYIWTDAGLLAACVKRPGAHGDRISTAKSFNKRPVLARNLRETKGVFFV